MTYQSNANAVVAYKAQAGLGSPASGGSGIQLRTTGGPGALLSKAAIESNEVRADGMRSRGRHGTQKTNSSYTGELSLGSHDPILEAVLRGTWDSSALSATSADFTTVTTGANTIVAAGGSWITKGFRVGEIIRGSSFPDAGNNNRNLRIVGLTASTITVAETLIVRASPSGAPTITRPGKRLIQPATPVKRYFTLDEYEVDIDRSTVLADFVWSSFKLSMSPNGLITLDPGGVGTGQISTPNAASSPTLTSPVATTGAPMSVVDATIRYGSADVASLTAFDLTADIGASAPDVFGAPGTKYAPDVFAGQLALSMNLTMLRTDLAELENFINETALSLHILAVDKMSAPENFISIYVPNFTLGGHDQSALSKQGGGRTQTLQIPAALVGKDVSGGAFDPTMIKIQTNAA